MQKLIKQTKKRKKTSLKKKREEQKSLHIPIEEPEIEDPLEYSPLDVRDENGDPVDLYTFFTSTKR